MVFESYVVPISVKAIIFEDDKVWLRFNQRNEWELPGGKMDPGEQPEETVIREIKEELGFNIKVIDIIQAHLYTIKVSPDESKGVLVVSYLCELVGKAGDFEVQWEEGTAQFKSFDMNEIDALNMPAFYKEAIKKSYLEKDERN